MTNCITRASNHSDATTGGQALLAGGWWGGTGLGTWFCSALIPHTSVCQMLLAPFPDSRLRHRSTVNWLAQWHSFFSGRGRVRTWIYVLIPLSFSVAFLRVTRACYPSHGTALPCYCYQGCSCSSAVLSNSWDWNVNFFCMLIHSFIYWRNIDCKAETWRLTR